MDGATIHIKSTKKIVENFAEKAVQYGMKPSDMHRLLIEAFIDNRMTITPTEEQRNLFGNLLNTKDKE